jgi:hypothetical protein
LQKVSVITTTNSDEIDLKGCEHLSIQCVIDVDTPSAKSFATSDVNATDDEITEAAHGYTTGLKGQCTTTTTLPAMDATFAAYWHGDADMTGTEVTAADVNAQSFTFTPPLGDNDTKGEVILGSASHVITISVDNSSSFNPTYVENEIKIMIKDSIAGTVFDTSPPGFTSPGVIEYTTSQLIPAHAFIVITV